MQHLFASLLLIQNIAGWCNGSTAVFAAADSCSIQDPATIFYWKGGLTQEATNVSTELAGFLSQIKAGMSDFNVTNMGTIIIAGIGLAVAPAIAWFGFRFVKGKVAKAFFKGKL